MKLSRRQLLGLLAATPAAAADGKLIIRSARPEDFEMPLDGFQTWITPVERFFVRTHLYNPSIKMGEWRLRVGGLVANPLTLELAELRRFPRVELTGVLECAGNGRSLYEPKVAGTQWKYGGVGNARWSGVRLADVLRKAGLKAGVKEILFNGADIPLGTMPDFRRALPVQKALDADTLLAFEMNGKPLTLSHGYPLRLISPGWAGDSWVKWVTDIDARDTEFDGFFMKTAYRRPVRTVMPGSAVDPAQMTPVTSIRPKSVIATPLDGQVLAAGPLVLRGAAWSNESPVARVDVSTDGGRTWKPARLGADRAKYAWRLWEHRWTPPGPGSYVLMAAAQNEAGERQPLAEDWNPSGYLYNVVQQVRVGIGGTPSMPAETAAPIPAFPAKLKASCVGCHGEDVIAGQHLTRAQWERELSKMQSWGATVKPEDKSEMLDFLLSRFGPMR